MVYEYEIDKLTVGESWRVLRIVGELVTGFDKLADTGSAVTIYGSARIQPGDEVYARTEEIAYKLGKLGFAIVTGGGGGVMEAANKGALEAGVASIGINIEIPVEQVHNAFTTKELTFSHFFVRKIMLVKYAIAFIAMPGGLGTLDELTEVLTLIQTRKIKPFPVVLYDDDYWKGFLDWLCNFAMARKYISEEDLHLVRVCRTPDEVVDTVKTWHVKQQVVGRRVLARRQATG